MGLRFHKSLKMFPGVRLNLNKGIPSISVGGKGLTFNINKKGAKTTLGAPGTGLSYSANTSYKNGSKGMSALTLLAIGVVIMLGYLYVKSNGIPGIIDPAKPAVSAEDHPVVKKHHRKVVVEE